MKCTWPRELCPGTFISWKGPRGPFTIARLDEPRCPAPAPPQASWPWRGYPLRPLSAAPALSPQRALCSDCQQSPPGSWEQGPQPSPLSQGLQPLGSVILGWPGGLWHTGPVQETVSQDYYEEGDSVQGAHVEWGQDLGLSILGFWGRSSVDSDHPNDPRFTGRETEAPTACLDLSMLGTCTSRVVPSGGPRSSVCKLCSAPQRPIPRKQHVPMSLHVPVCPKRPSQRYTVSTGFLWETRP